jgi:hypothetical protein
MTTTFNIFSETDGDKRIVHTFTIDNIEDEDEICELAEAAFDDFIDSLDYEEE